MWLRARHHWLLESFQISQPCCACSTKSLTSSKPTGLPEVSSTSQGLPVVRTGLVTCDASSRNWGRVRSSGMGGQGPAGERYSIVLCDSERSENNTNLNLSGNGSELVRARRYLCGSRARDPVQHFNLSWRADLFFSWQVEPTWTPSPDITEAQAAYRMP